MGLLIRTQGAPSMILVDQLIKYHSSLWFKRISELATTSGIFVSLSSKKDCSFFDHFVLFH